jgi:hypothetical protein
LLCNRALVMQIHALHSNWRSLHYTQNPWRGHFECNGLVRKLSANLKP